MMYLKNMYLKNKGEIVFKYKKREMVIMKKVKDGILLCPRRIFNYMVNDKVNAIAVIDRKLMLPFGIIKFDNLEFKGINMINNHLHLRGRFENFHINNELDGIEN